MQLLRLRDLSMLYWATKDQNSMILVLSTVLTFRLWYSVQLDLMTSHLVLACLHDTELLITYLAPTSTTTQFSFLDSDSRSHLHRRVFTSNQSVYRITKQKRNRKIALFLFYGSGDWARTSNQVINSHLLYH